MSSQKDRRGSRRMRSGFGTASLPSDSPFFQAACSPMDYSPVGVVADLTRAFIEEDDCSSGSSGAASRRGVYIHTEDDNEGDDDGYLDDGSDDSHHLVFSKPEPLESGSPSRSSSASSIYIPSKRRASMSAVTRLSESHNN